MPSVDHEAILELFRRRLTLADELLREVARKTPLRPLAHARLGDTALTEILPTERTADLLLLLSESPTAPPRRAIIVEVQLAIDPAKRRSWWSYLVGVHVRHGCDAVLVIVTPSASVAAWAARPLRLGHPGVSLVPVVIGPRAVPLIVDEAAAVRAPELAVLSVMMHGHGEAAVDVAMAALGGVRGLDEDRVRLYTDVVLLSLRATARAKVEDLMGNGAYEYRSDFARRYVAQGKAEAKAQAILTILDARGVDVPTTLRDRVLACADLGTLDVWIVRAATARAAAEVVGE